MKKPNKIICNAVKILDYLIENNAMAGRGAKVKDIFDGLELQKEDFDIADSYLLQQHYVDGTMGGLDGSRYLNGTGVEFYEINSALIDANPIRKGNEPMPDSKKVFVVHGRDGRLRDDFFAFLRSLNLDPIEWSEALKLTGKATPYIGEALESAFKNAQAVIVLLSPDDEARLSPELWKDSGEENEKEFKLQARPNVLFEAGMAFGTHPDRTLLIEVGQVKAFSDVAGRHVVKLSNNAEKRNEIAERLRTVGCEVKTIGSDWLTTGNFNINRGDKSKPAKNTSYKHSDLDAGDILALLDDWWPKSYDSVPDDVKVNFNEVDELLDMPSGSTKKYITQVARKKGFKCGASGNVFGVFEYDVSLD